MRVPERQHRTGHHPIRGHEGADRGPALGPVLFQDKLDTAQILEFFKTQAELKNPEQQCARPSPTPAPGSSTTPSEAPSSVPSSAAPLGGAQRSVERRPVEPGRQPGHLAQPVLTGAIGCACTPTSTASTATGSGWSSPTTAS